MFVMLTEKTGRTVAINLSHVAAAMKGTEFVSIIMVSDDTTAGDFTPVEVTEDWETIVSYLRKYNEFDTGHATILGTLQDS